jgi:hypothetical protein
VSGEKEFAVATDATAHALPRQRTEEPPTGAADQLAQLTELAASLSAQASRREAETLAQEREIVPLSAATPRFRRRLWPAIGATLAVAVTATSIVTAYRSVHTKPHHVTDPGVRPASVAVARSLGQAAGDKLRHDGSVPDAATCADAYDADRAASPRVLPAPNATGAVTRAYLAACTASAIGR